MSDKPKCGACFDSKWWCRGCGGGDKIDAMEKAGIDKDMVGFIYSEQFGCCSKPLVPCYLCNRNGKDTSSKVLKGLDLEPDFWEGM